MGMTMTEKILAQHAGRDAVQAGDLLVAQVDLVLANDITGPPAIAEFEKIGRPVFDKDKIALVPDHFSPCKDIKSATMCKRMRDFARQHEITNYFEVGRMGIEHALLPDSGLVAPGEIIIGADSHTCTYGALNALSTGMGQTDIGAAMASGTTWFKVPATIKVELTGKLPKYVKGKDIILTLIGMIGVDGARYQSLEFCGDGVAELQCPTVSLSAIWRSKPAAKMVFSRSMKKLLPISMVVSAVSGQRLLPMLTQYMTVLSLSN